MARACWPGHSRQQLCRAELGQSGCAPASASVSAAWTRAQGMSLLPGPGRRCCYPESSGGYGHLTSGCLKSVPATCLSSLQTRLRAALQWYALSAKGQGHDCACLWPEHINNRQDWPAQPHRLRRACPACRGGGTARRCRAGAGLCGSGVLV